MKFGTLFLNGLRHLICFTWTFAIWNRKKASRFLQSLLLGRNIWFGTLDISAKGLSFGSEDMTLLCTARLRNQCMLCRCFLSSYGRGASLDQYCPQWFQMKAVLFQIIIVLLDVKETSVFASLWWWLNCITDGRQTRKYINWHFWKNQTSQFRLKFLLRENQIWCLKACTRLHRW